MVFSTGRRLATKVSPEMFRAAWKSLLGRKLRLIMSTFAIVLGVAFVAGSLIFTDTLGRSFTALFASTVGDVVVRPEGGNSVDGAPSTRTIPASVLDDLSAVAGAARVDGNVSAFGVYVVSDQGKIIGGQGAPGIGSNWTGAPAGHGIDGFGIVAGRAPAASGEVVLDRRTAELAGYDIGDTVRIVTAGTQATLAPRLVGTADFEGGGSLNGASVCAFDTATAQDLFVKGRDVYTDIWVTADDGLSQEELKASVTPLLSEDLEAVTGDEAADETASALEEALGFIQTFLLVFAAISLVVGSFLIVNTFSILVAQRSRELALLRAMGATRGQVLRSVLAEALLLGVLGSTLGLVLGIGLASALKALFAQFGLDLSGQSLVFEPSTVVVSYAVGIVITVLAALFPAWRTGRIAPVQAMRDDIAMPPASLRRRSIAGAGLLALGGAALGAGLFADIPRPLWYVGAGVLGILLAVAALSPTISKPFLTGAAAAYTRVFGSVGTLAGQNSLRNPRRTTATASALMIGLALASTMAIVGASAKASVDDTIAENFVGDYVVSSTFGQAFSPAIGTQMAAIDGVDAVVPQRFGLTERDGDPEPMASIDPAALTELLKLDFVKGRAADLTDGRVIVSEQWADDLGIEVGDQVSLDAPSGTKSYPVTAIFAENPMLAADVVTTPATYLQAGFPDSDNFLIVDVDRQSAELESRLAGVVEDNPLVTVKDQQALADEQRGPIDRLVLMIFALLALALVIASLGIVNTLALSMIERTREVGLLRAIGLSRRQLRRMITLESVVISVLGALLGVACGMVFGVALMYALRDEGLRVIEIPGGQLGLFLALSILIGVVAALLPARRAARLDVLQAISTE
ncbi:MAG: ABC transporter permease [Nocardioides sp.]